MGPWSSAAALAAHELGCPKVKHEDAISSSGPSTEGTILGAPLFDDLDRPWELLLRQTRPAAALSQQPPLIPLSSLSFEDFSFLCHLDNDTDADTNTNIDCVSQGHSSNCSSTRRSGVLLAGNKRTTSAASTASTATFSTVGYSTSTSLTRDADPSPLETFFYAASSGSPSIEASIGSGNNNPENAASSVNLQIGRGRPRHRVEGASTGRMTAPATLAAPECAGANVAANNGAGSTIQTWRPHSARSASRSPSPLLSRWTRKHHLTQQQEAAPGGGGRKSSSSSRRSNLLLTPPEATGTMTTTITANMRSSSSSNGRSNSNNSNIIANNDGDKEAARQSGSFQANLTREEFEALPLAIQRKYFSTLERLRFAQTSGMVDGIYRHYDDITALNIKRRRPRQDRSASDQFARRLRRRSLRGSPYINCDPLSVPNLHDRISKRPYTREEQLVLARNLRDSVILDAADEAIYKIGRRASRNLTPDFDIATPALSSKRNSMDSNESERRESEAAQQGNKRSSLYESFRWLDEEEDLDLRLFLDDYHANLREELPSPSKERRPSFRRHLSITKIPFGRPSLSASRPATKDAATSPVSPPFPGSPLGPTGNAKPHTRRRSRTLSLITAKNAHSRQDSITAIDSAATHYQDPDARLKLRVYLASPQKFDEAIEFGFPSADALGAPPASHYQKDRYQVPEKRQSRQKSVDSAHLKTFLADDDEDDDDIDDRLSSTRDDAASPPDPASPETPQLGENPAAAPIRPMRVSPDSGMTLTHSTRPSESYAQAPASSREMTLRMTLTRPDLRAHEEQIYGWQPKVSLYQPGHRSPSDAKISAPKESMEQVFAGMDHWGPDTTDKGVMKRIWNRVRRS
ncbi:Mucin [Pleurostoma richardsiae]|uniref:Mucin n=1 Tax=Pleurostoma richardsiae TaxID=41990 RepID=A0AA38S801_9PEZI|nr:Mucin [Pleurostoma richardsiae]